MWDVLSSGTDFALVAFLTRCLFEAVALIYGSHCTSIEDDWERCLLAKDG